MDDTTTILVVDDQVAVATTLADILLAKGFKVRLAVSGEEALQILKEDAVDILLTDVRMPDMNGVSLYREARKIAPALTTYMMTAYAADEIIQQGMKEGIKTVLTKPLDIDLMIALFTAYKNLSKRGG
jgi:DNA-binding NtrC family response regulator